MSVKFIVGEAMKDESKRDLKRCAELVAQCFASKDYIEGRTGLHGEAQAGLHRYLNKRDGRIGIGARGVDTRRAGRRPRRCTGEEMRGVGRIARPDQALRRLGGGGRRVAAHRARPSGLPAGPVRLRQDHDAAADRRLRRADRRRDPGRRRGWSPRRRARCRPSGATCR